jgi:hypothetical protein
VKVGDLVSVAATGHKMMITVITGICLPAQHRNGMYLIQVIEKGTSKWYPVGFVTVIREA